MASVGCLGERQTPQPNPVGISSHGIESYEFGCKATPKLIVVRRDPRHGVASGGVKGAHPIYMGAETRGVRNELSSDSPPIV